MVDEVGGTLDGEVGFEITDQSPVSQDIGIPTPILPIKQLPTSTLPNTTHRGKPAGEDYVLITTIKISREDKIRESQSFADKVSMILQVSIKVFHDSFDISFGMFDGLFVVHGIATKSWEIPSTEGREDFVV
jgi:hypothetical protein